MSRTTKARQTFYRSTSLVVYRWHKVTLRLDEGSFICGNLTSTGASFNTSRTKSDELLIKSHLMSIISKGEHFLPKSQLP